MGKLQTGREWKLTKGNTPNNRNKKKQQQKERGSPPLEGKEKVCVNQKEMRKERKLRSIYSGPQMPTKVWTFL